jgi:hypothetical protein
MKDNKFTCLGTSCDARDFYRAEGSCVCKTCRKLYREHPFCANSELPESMQLAAIFREYSLNVLCNGDHVHL